MTYHRGTMGQQGTGMGYSGTATQWDGSPMGRPWEESRNRNTPQHRWLRCTIRCVFSRSGVSRVDSQSLEKTFLAKVSTRHNELGPILRVCERVKHEPCYQTSRWAVYSSLLLTDKASRRGSCRYSVDCTGRALCRPWAQHCCRYFTRRCQTGTWGNLRLDWA